MVYLCDDASSNNISKRISFLIINLKMDSNRSSDPPEVASVFKVVAKALSIEAIDSTRFLCAVKMNHPL